MNLKSKSQFQNIEYINAVKAYEPRLRKPVRSTPTAERWGFFLRAYNQVAGQHLSKDEQVIDFGCGSGAATQWFTEQGYTIDGVDILQYWKRDAHLLGEVGPSLPDRVMTRLHVIDPTDNHLPFPDSSVEFIFSDQTLEHVFDYRPVFKEQSRVLKSGGVAIHRFPHHFSCIEPHTNVPFTYLNRFSWYLLMWAIMGRRNERQKGLDWRETVNSNRKLLATTNYISKKEVLQAAEDLDVDVWFQNFLPISEKRTGRLYAAATAFGIGPLVRIGLSLFQQNRVVVLTKHRNGSIAHSRGVQKRSFAS